MKTFKREEEEEYITRNKVSRLDYRHGYGWLTAVFAQCELSEQSQRAQKPKADTRAAASPQGNCFVSYIIISLLICFTSIEILASILPAHTIRILERDVHGHETKTGQHERNVLAQDHRVAGHGRDELAKEYTAHSRWANVSAVSLRDFLPEVRALQCLRDTPAAQKQRQGTCLRFFEAIPCATLKDFNEIKQKLRNNHYQKNNNFLFGNISKLQILFEMN